MISGIITMAGPFLSQRKVHAVLHGAKSFCPKEPAYSIQF